jgi:hypothetical protein
MSNRRFLDAAWRRFPLLTFSLVACAAAHAAPGAAPAPATPASPTATPPPSCEWSDFAAAPGARLSSAAIKAKTGARVYFYKAGAGCPQGGEKLCRDET